jgi:diacylglycerol kinase (ATP)
MSARRIRILVNPAARARSALRGLHVETFDGATLEWLDCPTAGQLQEQVRRGQEEGLDVLALAGGGGTIAIALNALTSLNRVPLGIIPTGAGNDFARDLNIPRAPAEALQLLCTGQPRRVDVARAFWPGHAEQRRFAATASVGLDELALRILQGSRWPRSRTLHVVAALRALWDYRPRRLRVEWRDGGFEGEALFVAVTNTRAYGGVFQVSPQARLNDGLLDICIIKQSGRLRLLTQFPRLLQGTHDQLPEVILAQSPSARLEGLGEELQLALDGELSGAMTPVEFQCEPAALQVLLPQVQAEAALPELAPISIPAFQGGI